MNLAEQMLAKTKEVTNREKIELLFNELVLPVIERAANNKQREASFSSFSSSKEDRRVKEVYPARYSLQNLIETDMKPYIEEQGFKVVICSPNYYVYIRW